MTKFQVNSKMCSTCIFGKRSPISPERFKELEQAWEEEGVQQECHQSSMQGNHVACRGHFNAALRNEYVNYPLIKAVKELTGWAPPDLEHALRVCAMYGLVEEVDVGEE